MTRLDQLQTARLTLRRATETDLPAMHAIFSIPEAMRYWSTPEHESLAETEVWMARMIAADPATSDDFLIEHQGQIIGKAGAWNLPEVGFILHPAHWRKGIVAEAMSAVIPYLFETHAIPDLTAEADPRNAASIGLLQRLGFRETHRAERTMQWRDEWCDSVYLALPRHDWAGYRSR